MAAGVGHLHVGVAGDTDDMRGVADIDALALDMTQGKVKVSFFGADRKAVKVAELVMADGSVKNNVSGLTLSADDKVTDSFTLADIGDAVKYLKVEAASKTLCAYTIA